MKQKPKLLNKKRKKTGEDTTTSFLCKLYLFYFNHWSYLDKLYRIRHANNAAAAFYTKCLVILPTAGKARAYLRSRSISPDSIRTFAVGYAPGERFSLLLVLIYWPFQIDWIPLTSR